MKVVVGYPENWEQVKAKLPFSDSQQFFLTLGDTLYNPFNLAIEKSYMVHEEYHSRRQLRMGLEKYFQIYLDNPVFRFVEELRAYRIQWLYIMNHGGPHIDQLASEFSNPNYGYDVSLDEAKDLILNGI